MTDTSTSTETTHSHGNDDLGSLFTQVKGTMLITVFVFLGVEGASVYSCHARRREDVGRATVLGFLMVFAVFAYTLFLLVAAGPKFILVSFIIYAPASVLFVMARREQGRQLFSPRELVILAISVIGALAGLVALFAGWISL